MIDEAFKTHKEATFGWVLALHWIAAALKASSKARRERRFLTPR